jgi:peptidoglycan/LPS O-acetylase OafA/YrhL
MSWDVIRVIAIADVVLFHTSFLGHLSYPDAIPAAPFAWTHPFGATVLLAVSGYFAAATIGKHSPRLWFTRRMARLLPAYLLAVVVVFTLLRLFSSERLADLHNLTFFDLAGNLLMLQQLLQDTFHFVDVSYWTLPVQMAAFIGMALLARYRSARPWVAPAVLWTLVLVPLAVREVWMSAPPAWLVMVMEGTGLCRMEMLGAGVAIWLWSQRRMSSAHLALLLLATMVGEKVHPPNDSVVLIGVMLGLMCLAARGPDWDLPGLRRLRRPIGWIAGCSYGIYLLHQSLGYLVEQRLAERGVDPWVWLVTVIAMAVLAGWALTRWVERPAYSAVLRLLPPRDDRDAVGSGASTAASSSRV